ncbi:MAG TPA: transporter [Burkholderiales bacterium]|nr:transporter [Burkholderiales bacterium]
MSIRKGVGRRGAEACLVALIPFMLSMAPSSVQAQTGKSEDIQAQPKKDKSKKKKKKKEDYAQLRHKLDAAQQELTQLRRSMRNAEQRSKADRAELEAQRKLLQQLEARIDGESRNLAALDKQAEASARDKRPDPPSRNKAVGAAPAEDGINTALGEAFNTASLQTQAGRGAETIAQAPTQPAQQTPAPATPTVGQAPEQPQQTRPPEIAPIFDQPGVLTPRGKYVLEPGFEYVYSSSNRVSILGFLVQPLLIGRLDIRRANNSSYTAVLTGRYGITNRMEAELKLPYVYRTETLQTRDILNRPVFVDEDFTSSGNGIGDVEMALRYQMNQGGMEKPYYIGTLRLKTRTGKDQFEIPIDPNVPGRLTKQPTGTGFYALRPELTVIYPTDPIVFFGSLNYLWNIKRNNVTNREGQTNDIDPGDAIGFNFGMGLALNERASFSVGYEHTIFGKNKFNGQTPPTELVTQLGTLLVGYSYRLTPSTNFNVALGIGATHDAPDVQINLRFPMTF